MGLEPSMHGPRGMSASFQADLFGVSKRPGMARPIQVTEHQISVTLKLLCGSHKGSKDPTKGEEAHGIFEAHLPGEITDRA